MGLRELALYGRDKKFGAWLHQQCIYVRNNAEVATKHFQLQKLASTIDPRHTEALNDVVGSRVQALFVTYLILAAVADRGEEYLGKRSRSIEAIIRTVLGPATYDVYAQCTNHVVTSGVNPESAIAHLLVDPLEVPLGDERDALENTFNFFEYSIDEYYAPALKETFAHNRATLNDMLETFGHDVG